MQAEQTILRVNRLYAALGATIQAIVHAEDRDSIFREFCRVTVELVGFRLAWVGLLDNWTGVLRVVAASGETGYLDSIRISGEPEPDGTGLAGVAIREETCIICNDFMGSEITRPWHERAHAHGIYASASIAIKQNHEVIGALTLYAGEKYFFDSRQAGLLQQIGSDVSFALDSLHQAALRRDAELALQQETIERLQAVEELRKKEQLLIQQSRLAALGEMIGNIAHQWRQPLNTLGLLIQQVPICYRAGEVNQEFLDNNARQSMELIQYMSRTIDDFRNFFKPEKEKVVFKVNDEVTKILSLMKESLRAQNIDIKVTAEEDLVIHGYPNEFSQVLLNILINARDALTEREIAMPKVLISIGSGETGAVVTIADNAGGISEEIIDKIFEPYFTTKGSQAGTGVGLFMSKTIIERNMGGLLTVRNIEDGAEFRIEV
jgi:C4-dicarboxylate-specific signal transduction histidine kinase